jgi:hypothetical protein
MTISSAAVRPGFLPAGEKTYEDFQWLKQELERIIAVDFFLANGRAEALAALDFFGYWAHRLLHQSWLGYRLCGTYTPRIDFGELRYGLDGFDDPHRQSLRGLLTTPFVKFE